MPISRLRRRVLRQPVVRTVLSVWAWLVFGVVIALLIPTVAIVRLVTFPFDKARYYPGYVFRRGAVVHQWLNPLWHFTTSGVTVDDPRHPYVVVSNHQSFVDMLLISHLPWEMKWLAKRDFFRYPGMGQIMHMIGDIRLERGDRDSVIAAMGACAARLDRRVSVMIFPEGTRSRDGEVGPFRDGAFRLAVLTRTPVLPLAIVGTREAMIKGDWRFGVADAEVRVLPPVDTAGMTLDDVGVLRDKVHAMIATEVAALRAEHTPR
jgi:1-acyl-sn-glycerol-3-phosphate acyltransferase